MSRTAPRLLLVVAAACGLAALPGTRLLAGPAAATPAKGPAASPALAALPFDHVLPHAELCPEGKHFEARSGTLLCDALAAHGVAIEHACEKACVCTTCHVVIRDGFAALRPASDDEEDQLGKAWGLELTSHLSCQVRLPQQGELVVEIPRYSRNFVREH